MKFFKFVYRGYFGSEYGIGVRIGQRTFTVVYLTGEVFSFWTKYSGVFGEESFLRVWRIAAYHERG